MRLSRGGYLRTLVCLERDDVTINSTNLESLLIASAMFGYKIIIITLHSP